MQCRGLLRDWENSANAALIQLQHPLPQSAPEYRSGVWMIGCRGWWLLRVLGVIITVTMRRNQWGVIFLFMATISTMSAANAKKYPLLYRWLRSSREQSADTIGTLSSDIRTTRRRMMGWLEGGWGWLGINLTWIMHHIFWMMNSKHQIQYFHLDISFHQWNN